MDTLTQILLTLAGVELLIILNLSFRLIGDSGIIKKLEIENMMQKKKIKEAGEYKAEVIQSFNAWLTQSLALHVSNYVMKITATEMITDNEISINGTFAIEGIEYVGKEIFTTMPNMFYAYMVTFYGDDTKFITTVNSKITSVFMEYINAERTRRINGTTLSNIKKNR